MNDDTNALIDAPADVAEPEIDAAACAAWLAAQRLDEAPWWWDMALPDTTDESPFTQALRLTISSRRE